MAASEPAFLEKVGELQRQLHCSEQKRLELEKNLLTCSKSNQLMVRGARLKSYLKELCEREKIAQLRNHQLLKDFESIEAQVTALTSGSDTLKQIKASNSSRQRVTDVREDLSKALDTTATCILDQQESRTSNRTCTSPQQKHQQHMESFTSSQPYRQTASVTAMHSNSVMDNLKLPMSSKGRQDFHTVSDTIERKTGLQTSEVMPFTPIISSRSERHHYEGIESNRRIRANSSAGSQELPVPVTQLEPIKEELTQDTMLNDFKSRLTDEVNSHKNVIVSEHAPEWFQRLPMDSFHDSVCSGGFSMNIKENNLCQFVSSQNQRKDVEEALMQSQDVQRLADELCDSESDLSISGNAEELQLKKSFEEPCNHKTAINDDPARTSESAFTKDKSSAVSKEEHIVPFLNQPDQKDHGGSVEGDLHEELCEIITQSQQNEGYLSLEGFFHLLQTIEDAVEETMATYSELYQHATMSNEKLQEISSTCNLKGPVSRENLQACGAIVLHQLKRLSQSTSNGCLLSEEILNKDWEAVDGGSHRLSDLPADSATLWDRWYLHVLSMLEHQVLTTDEAAEIFGPLLVAESSNNSKKATALLKKILPKAVENQSLPSDDSSYSLPSIFNDDIEIKSEIPVPWFDLNNTKQQETRAYQLLKQLAMQQNEKDVSDLHSSGKSKQKYTNKLKNEVKDEDNFETGSSEGSPQLRARNKRERINPAKSKAFWGESDDSASDIEAILHPNISEVLEDGDDFDDFF
ncbi:centrosomal protein kizuna isoform X2 [Carcharodon carcharias]|uniref:centrosomal protein kizuna isoform X2 n=1 Tax=Carcharodon carcharias TaxID=13397 RepID=UPI001B7D95C5|nr:centrosomal protein kizuna isoform X2 [Carcharodon carcharias]